MNRVLEIFAQYGLNIENEKAEKLSRYIDLLINAPLNLTSIKDFDQAVHKHAVDVLLPVPNLCGEVLDAGTGGGVPGIIYAIVFPVKVFLVDSTRKKIIWLQSIIRELEITNAETFCSRIEELGHDMRERFDVLTARALAELRITAELCAAFCKINGKLLFYKGPKWQQEYKKAEHTLKVLGLELEDIKEYSLRTGEQRSLLIFRKLKRTSQLFPRRISEILKKPL